MGARKEQDSQIWLGYMSEEHDWVGGRGRNTNKGNISGPRMWEHRWEQKDTIAARGSHSCVVWEADTSTYDDELQPLDSISEGVPESIQ